MKNFDVYAATIIWHGRPRIVTLSGLEMYPVIGMGLLDGSEVNIKVRPGGKVTIRPLRLRRGLRIMADFPSPWRPVGNEVAGPCEAELQRELGPGHQLFGIKVRAIARRYDQDDVLFELLDGTGRVAEVHLTYARYQESPVWPMAVLFSDYESWVRNVREDTESGL